MGGSRYLVCTPFLRYTDSLFDPTSFIAYLLAFSSLPSSWNHGQACCAGSRIYVQAGIYDAFLKKFTEKTESLKVGDPFALDSDQGPQVSEVQYEVRL